VLNGQNHFNQNVNEPISPLNEDISSLSYRRLVAK